MLPASVSRLGFGVTGPHATALVAPAATAALVRRALDLGVTLFDTGPMYGAGEGERRLGAALKGVDRARAFVSTKARTWSPGDDRAPAAIVRASLADSLARLGLAHVDALFLHGPRPEDVAAAAPALADLKAAGTIRFAGVCGRGAELDAALATEGVDLLMMPVTGDQRARLEAAAARGIAVFAIETLRGAPRPPPAQAADLWYLARAARDALAGRTAPQGAGVAAALALPAVRSVIVTTTRARHLAENARAAA